MQLKKKSSDKISWLLVNPKHIATLWKEHLPESSDALKLVKNILQARVFLIIVNYDIYMYDRNVVCILL